MAGGCRCRALEFGALTGSLRSARTTISLTVTRCRAVMDRMLSGVSTRKFARVGEPVGTSVEATARSKAKAKAKAKEHGVGDVHREDPHRAGGADGPA